jgi:predicted RNase H-like HicB family nuclease
MIFFTFFLFFLTPPQKGMWYNIHREEKRAMCTRKDVETVFKPRIHSEDGRYWAEIPAMPGCLTVADTLDELRDNLIEAAQCWLLTYADMENYRRNDRRRITRKRKAVALA